MRRDHVKYLSLIASLTLLHQHQRERTTRQRNGKDEECVIATREDVEMANQLASESLGQSLDSLMPQTRQLLVLLDDYVIQRAAKEKTPKPEVRFTQRELREAFGWSDRQLRRHLKRLVELEYVLAYRTGQRNGREYSLLYDGQGRDGEPFLLGLLDASKLRKRQTGGRKNQTGGPKKQSAPTPAAVRQHSGKTSAKPKKAVSRATKKTSAPTRRKAVKK